MNHLLKIIINVFIIFMLTEVFSMSSENTKIILKIDNEIITNIDIENEYKYLTILNPDLKKMNKEKALIVAKASLIKEKVKLKELVKFFDLKVESTRLSGIIKNFYKTKGLTSESEFIEYLKNNEIKFQDVKNKIQIETAWNELIYKRYKNNIKIDKEKLRESIKKQKENEESYLLYEIMFTSQKDKKLIEESIKSIGFKNTATTYSISNSSKSGGKIGWIKETQLSKKVAKLIKNLKVGENTKPIETAGGNLILLLDNIKKVETNIDVENELSRLINYETNKQLNQMSNMYYNKIKNNTLINEN